MARPREFDETQLLDSALEVFWRKGFDGASVQDVVDATGVVRASLYGAFGDKDGLFRAAIRHYYARFLAHVGPLGPDESGLAWLRRLCAASIDSAFARGGPKGCFLQLAATQCTKDRDESRAVIAGLLQSAHKSVLSALTQAQARGELADDAEPALEAKHLMLLLGGIAASARQGGSRADAEAVVTRAIDRLQGRVRAARSRDKHLATQ